jgi:hypothetical protein
MIKCGLLKEGVIRKIKQNHTKKIKQNHKKRLNRTTELRIKPDEGNRKPVHLL